MNLRWEEIFKKVFPIAIESSGKNVYYYDYTLGKRRVEIKTKMCTTIPNINYECSIYNYFQQAPEFYFFVRVIKRNGEYPHGWLLGYISEKQFKAYKSSGYNASESFYLRSFEVTAEL